MAELNPTWQNFEALVNEVLNFGFNDGPQVNKGRIEGWINEGQQVIARKVDAPEFEKSKELTLVQNQYKYDLPEDFLRMEVVYSPELVTRLQMIDLQQFDSMGHGEAGVARVVAPPMYYTLYGKELWVFPIPPNGEVIELRYIAKPVYMTTATAIPTLNTDYWHLLVKWGIIRAFEAEDDFELASQHMTRFKADLDDYASDVQHRMDDRPLIVDGTWGAFGTAGTRGVL
jgi:hypothetical protein